MLHRLEAINLKTIPYSESSQIVIVFTREMGRMGLMAKGVRKSKQSSKGKLQSFMHNTYIINKKTGMGLISAIDTLHPFYGLSMDLAKLESAYNCLNLSYRAIQEGHPNEPLFDLLLRTLHKIETGIDSLTKTVDHFKRELIQIEGLLPDSELSEYSIDRTLQEYLHASPVSF